VDGRAVAAVAAAGRGGYTATASIGGITSPQLAIAVGGAAAPASSPPPPAPASASKSSSSGNTGLVLLIVIPIAVVALIVASAATFVVWTRRRRRVFVPQLPLPVTEPAVVTSGSVSIAVAEPPPPAAPPVLEVDLETRRVYVHGNEAKPGLSNEQFRLLAYLSERRGKVVPREELVSHIWPDAHAEGVSEEALDALVRRVRERIVQAGGERGYIVTLRGQGFRLEV
jgi:hypothetical protein